MVTRSTDEGSAVQSTIAKGNNVRSQLFCLQNDRGNHWVIVTQSVGYSRNATVIDSMAETNHRRGQLFYYKNCHDKRKRLYHSWSVITLYEIQQNSDKANLSHPARYHILRYYARLTAVGIIETKQA